MIEQWDKINKEIEDLNTINLTYIQKSLPSISGTYSSLVHKKYSPRYTPLLVHKTSINKAKKNKGIPNIFYHNRIRNQINNRKKPGKFTDMWKLNNAINQSMGQRRNDKDKEKIR